MRSTLVSALVAASLVIVPTGAIASSSPAVSKLSLRNSPAVQARVGAQTEDPSRLGGSLMLIGALAVAAVVGLIIILDDDDDEDSVSD